MIFNRHRVIDQLTKCAELAVAGQQLLAALHTVHEADRQRLQTVFAGIVAQQQGDLSALTKDALTRRHETLVTVVEWLDMQVNFGSAFQPLRDHVEDMKRALS